MTKRIEYIDALRGFTMLLVVFAHVETIGIFSYSHQTVIGQVFQSFRMPLFFFISGFIAYKAEFEWSASNTLKLLGKKLRVQIIPAAFWGALYTVLLCRSDFKTFLVTPEKFGYWFTFVLLEIFILYYLVNFLFKGKRRYIILVLLAFFLLACKVPFKQIDALDKLGNVTSLHYTFSYFLFFVFGSLASKYKDRFIRLLDNKYFTAAIVLLDMLLLYFMVSPDSTIVSSPYGTYIIKILDVLAGILGIMIVFGSFRKNEASMSLDTKLGCAMQYVGRRTLDIYLLHYFLIPDMSFLAPYFKSGNNVALELLVCLGTSALIVALCLLISNIIRISPFLAKYLFGARSDK